MIDINLIRTNPEMVKENIKKKFQDQKLVLVDEVLELDKKNRELKIEGDNLRASRNTLSGQIGMLMKNGEKEKAEEIKKQVAANKERLEQVEKEQVQIEAEIKTKMMTIPNIVDPSVPVGKDDSENVEIERCGEPKGAGYEIP